MQLKLTLQRAGTVDGQDILVDADSTTTVGGLASAIARRDPSRAGQPDPGSVTIRVDGVAGAVVLDPDLPLADVPLRSADHIALQGEGGTYVDGGDQRGAVAVISVVEGPDHGKQFNLRSGANQIGREAGNEVRLSDPLVSKRHARFNVTDILEVIDLGSVNGVLVGDALVDRAMLRKGDEVLIGESLLRVDQLNRLNQTDAVGQTIEFNRSPYLDPVYVGKELKAPDPPPPPQRRRFPAIAMVAPMLFGLVLYVFTRNLLTLLFMGLSPVMLVGTYFEGKRSAKADLRQATEQFRAALDHLRAVLTEVQAVETVERGKEHPATTVVVAAGAPRDPLLWVRRPDRHGFLELRLGLASLPTRSTVELPGANNTVPELWAELIEVIDDHHLVADVPVVGAMRSCGVIGVAGSLDASLHLARSLVVQVAGLHSPAEVMIGALLPAETSSHWDWLKWLPHTSSAHSPIDSPLLTSGSHGANALVAALRDLVTLRTEARRDAGTDDGPGPACVIVVDDDVPVDRSLLVDLAERGPEQGVHLIWVAPSVEALPAAAETYVAHDERTGQSVVGFIEGGRQVLPVAGDLTTGTEALTFARALSPLVDAGALLDDGGDLPKQVSFLDQVGSELANAPASIVERWHLSDSLPTPGKRPRKRAGPLQAVVGATAQGSIQLDLRAHGPHALVGGTTGAGKSEFLQSWILGMASTHSPSRVTFLFVDYKGGAAFSECVRLPHCVGMVTDLSPHLVRRALESLNAELRHREHILNRKKAKDVLELERLHDPDTPPSLVIIVDEFAALVSEVPEFVDGVVNVAQRGRSLGLHLILATQRPAGVIKDNLRANTNLRVALRMADEADSTDVIGTKGAAAFDPGVPGRGIAKLGPGRLSPFQAAYVGGWTTDQPPPAQVTVSAHEIGAVIEWPEPEEQEHVEETTDPGPNDLSRLVSTISAAALQARVPEPRKPWLPELGATYDLARSPKDDDDLRLLSRTDERLIFAVLDDPASQAQEPVSFDPDRDGNMMVLGTGGSGKSAFLRTLTVAAALSTRGGPCHVYGLDFASRGLDMLEPLPNVGSIISGDDEERVARLLRTLRETVDARLERYAAVRADSITRYREITGDMSEARILLLVDGFATFRQEYEGSGRLQTYDLFQSIATDGRQTGVHVVVAADRAGAIPSALGSVIQQRLVLRMASENEYAVVGVPSDAFPTGTPPGRGFFQEREVQVAVLGGTPNTARQAAAIEHLAEAARDRGVAVAPEVGRLPDAVSLDDLPVEAPGGGIAVGVADTDLAPFGLDLDGPMLIVGPPRSGKTTALVSIVQALQRRHDGLVTVYVGSGRSPAAKVLNWTHQVLAGANVTEHADPAKAALESAKPGQAVLVIDDAPKVSDWMDVDAVSALVEAATEHDHPILAEGETAAMSSSWGLLQALKAQRCGIALVPDQFDGDGVFKTPFPKLARKDFPPGRGLYVRNGQVEKVQLALPLGVHT